MLRNVAFVKMNMEFTRRSLITGASAGLLTGTASAAGYRKMLVGSAGVNGANGGTRSVIDFGITPFSPADSAAERAMRNHAIEHPASTYVFPPGEYNLTTPRFLFGVRDITIIAHGAAFRNVNAGKFAYSDLDASFYIGSGSAFHPMASGNFDAAKATSGAEIRDARAGDRFAVLVDRRSAADFKPSTWALVHWFSRQKNSFPPNPGYFEYIKIKAVDPETGVLKFDRPLRFAYKAQAQDHAADPTLYGSVCGRARILSLERPDYTICERFVLHGGKGIVTNFRDGRPSAYDGIIEVCGVIEAELYDVEFAGFYPAIARNVSVCRSAFPSGSEVDKIVECLTIEDTKFTDITQATGVQRFLMRGGSLSSSGRPDWNSLIRAHQIVLQGVEVASQGPRKGMAQVSIDAYAKALVDIDRCAFFPDSRQSAAIGTGDGVEFTPDMATATALKIAPNNPSYDSILNAIDYGSTISLVDGPDPDIFTVADIGFDRDGHLSLEGAHESATAPDPRSKRLLRSIGVLLDRGNNRIVAAPPGFHLLAPTRAVAKPRQQPNSHRRTLTCTLNGLQSYAQLIQGVVTRVTVAVEKPYSGDSQIAMLEIGKSGPGQPFAFGAIDLRTSGTRTVTRRKSAGARSRDTWSASIPANLWVENLTLRVRGEFRAGVRDPRDRAGLSVKIQVGTVD